MDIPLAVTIAVLVAALLHASWNALLKGSDDKELDTVAISVGAGIIGFAGVLLLPAPEAASWPWLAASAVVHIAYFLCLAGAYRWGELSYAYPIMRGGGPMVVALASAAAFGEVLALWQTLGVVLVCSGIVAFASGNADRRATAFALGNALIIAAYTLIDAKGARLSNNPLAYTLWFFALNAVAIYAWAGVRRGAEVPRYLVRYWPRMAIGAFLTTASYAIVLFAMTLAPVALVAVLRETSVLFAAAFGAIFFREKFTRRRLVATGAVLCGLVVLRL